MSRIDDTYLSLSERAIKSNNSDSDIFISIHQNAATATSANGVETFYSPINYKKGLQSFLHSPVNILLL